VNEASLPVPVVGAEGLTKRFGPLLALDSIDLQVHPGESVVLFGPNGAGKTTLVRILCLSLRPTSGRVSIAGLDPRREDLEIRQRIGLISHQSFLYDDLTARQNLEFFSRLHGVPDPVGRSEELLRRFELDRRADDAIGTFSRGMQQRVSLARSLVHDPSIVFLDEPFTGLDPYAAEMLRRTLEVLRDQRRTLVLVTHDLRQGLELSDRWLLLSRGRIVHSGRSSETDANHLDVASFRRLAQNPRETRPA
jgi:heme exporter protein A